MGGLNQVGIKPVTYSVIWEYLVDSCKICFDIPSRNYNSYLLSRMVIFGLSVRPSHQENSAVRFLFIWLFGFGRMGRHCTGKTRFEVDICSSHIKKKLSTKQSRFTKDLYWPGVLCFLLGPA